MTKQSEQKQALLKALFAIDNTAAALGSDTTLGRAKEILAVKLLDFIGNEDWATIYVQLKNALTVLHHASIEDIILAAGLLKTYKAGQMIDVEETNFETVKENIRTATILVHTDKEERFDKVLADLKKQLPKTHQKFLKNIFWVSNDTFNGIKEFILAQSVIRQVLYFSPDNLQDFANDGERFIICANYKDLRNRITSFNHL